MKDPSSSTAYSPPSTATSTTHSSGSRRGLVSAGGVLARGVPSNSFTLMVRLSGASMGAKKMPAVVSLGRIPSLSSVSWMSCALRNVLAGPEMVVGAGEGLGVPSRGTMGGVGLLGAEGDGLAEVVGAAVADADGESAAGPSSSAAAGLPSAAAAAGCVVLLDAAAGCVETGEGVGPSDDGAAAEVVAGVVVAVLPPAALLPSAEEDVAEGLLASPSPEAATASATCATTTALLPASDRGCRLLDRGIPLHTAVTTARSPGLPSHSPNITASVITAPSQVKPVLGREGAAARRWRGMAPKTATQGAMCPATCIYRLVTVQVAIWAP